MHNNRIKMLCLVILLAWLFAGCRDSAAQETELWVKESETDRDAAERRQETAEQTTEAAQWYVYVCGEVKHPGVYTVEYGARVYEAVEAAGGMTEEAAGERVNLAALLSDGQQVYIPNSTETAGQSEPGTAAADGLIDINSADAAQLQTLPGIGAARAEAIIAYREANGAFQSPEDIMKVSGIKEAAYNKIKDKIKTQG